MGRGSHLNMLVQEMQDSFPSELPLLWAFLKHSDWHSPGGEETPVSANCCFFHGLILKLYYILFTLHVCTSPTVCAEVSGQLVESIFSLRLWVAGNGTPVRKCRQLLLSHLFNPSYVNNLLLTYCVIINYYVINNY